MTTTETTGAGLEQILNGTLRRFTTDEYLQMIEAGILDSNDRVELIGGMIVGMSPAGSRHIQVLMRLVRIFAPILDRAEISVQATLAVTEGHVYDPDFMLLKPKPGGYKSALPRPEDVLLLIEASESSLRRDREVKLPVYAQAGISEYWIIDINKEIVIVHRQPEEDRYASIQTFSRGQRLNLESLTDFEISVEGMLD